MQYLANLPVSDKNNFKNVECNFTKGFPLKQVYPKDENQKYICNYNLKLFMLNNSNC